MGLGRAMRGNRIEQLEDRALLAAMIGDMYTVSAYNSIYTPLDQVTPSQTGAVSYVQAERYLPFALDRVGMESQLMSAPHESTVAAGQSAFLVSIPAPDGTLHTFDVVESPVMEPALAAMFPEIKTYLGQGLTDGAASIRFDVTPLGFHAQVLSPNGTYYIDPYYHLDESVYVSYFRADLGARPHFEDFTIDTDEIDEGVLELPESGPEAIVSRRDIRTTVTTTTSYNNFFGGTVANVLAAVTTAINRITGVYEVDSAIRLILVSDTTRLFSGLSGAGTDNPNGTIAGGGNVSSLSSNNQAFTDSRIGNANYDLGHVFHAGGFNGISGGGIGIVGRAGLKAQAATSGSPNGDVFYIDYVSHEMGHQFGGRHNFNNCSGSQGDSSAFANEPGSGSTIMGYAGICGATNIQNFSHAYFNYINLNQISTYINGAQPQGLAAPVPTSNNTPVIDPLSNYTIPDQTPFRLTATGMDPDGDVVSYTWEQANTGSGPIPLGTDPGAGPIIRSRPGVTSGERMIPPLANVLNGTFPAGETLPQTNRNLNFRVTARDNRAGAGGVTQATMVVTSANTGTGFMVTTPNANGITWAGGSFQTVNWNVSGSNAAPINTANVRILLSTDGGNTFPTELAASTANDGSEVVQMPFGVGTTQARIMVEAVGNIFFDISNFNFTITNVSPDTTPPTAMGFASDITLPGVASHVISVIYSDDFAVNAASIDDDDIVIQLPDSSTLPVTFLSRTSDVNTTPISAQYLFAPPGGSWDAADNGAYQILAVAGGVTDSSNNPILAGNIGSFDVNISQLPGDFNNDGMLDCNDVNALSLAIATGNQDLQYDVNNDAIVNFADLKFWVEDLKLTLMGDANLDFIVDGLDFIRWNENKFSSSTNWCDGNFNADMDVDGLDFITWNENKFTSADGAATRLAVELQTQDQLQSPTALRIKAVESVFADMDARPPVGAVPTTGPVAKALSSTDRIRPRSTADLDGNDDVSRQRLLATIAESWHK